MCVQRGAFQPALCRAASESSKLTTISGCCVLWSTICGTLTWRFGCSNHSKIHSGQKCYLCSKKGNRKSKEGQKRIARRIRLFSTTGWRPRKIRRAVSTRYKSRAPLSGYCRIPSRRRVRKYRAATSDSRRERSAWARPFETAGTPGETPTPDLCLEATTDSALPDLHNFCVFKTFSVASPCTSTSARIPGSIDQKHEKREQAAKLPRGNDQKAKRPPIVGAKLLLLR